MQVKTATVTGTEQAVVFNAVYNYYFVKNNTTTVVYATTKTGGGIVPYADDVVEIAVGESASVNGGFKNTIYLLGTADSGKVEIAANNSGNFKRFARGVDLFNAQTISGKKTFAVDITAPNISVVKSGFVAKADFVEGTYSGGFTYRATISNTDTAGLNPNYSVDVAFKSINDLQNAQTAGVAGVTETGIGEFYLYAMAKPTTGIYIVYTIKRAVG